MPSIFTPEQQIAYERDGYVLVRSLFDQEEIAILRGAIENLCEDLFLYYKAPWPPSAG